MADNKSQLPEAKSQIKRKKRKKKEKNTETLLKSKLESLAVLGSSLGALMRGKPKRKIYPNLVIC